MGAAVAAHHHPADKAAACGAWTQTSAGMQPLRLAKLTEGGWREPEWLDWKT